MNYYKLVGYDCPLRRYPSPAVPIVRNLFGKYKAVYLNDDLQIKTEPVSATAKFFRLSDCDDNLRKKLEKFDCSKQRLFALSENDVECYEVDKETNFFIQLLSDNNFSKHDPFARVLLAKATGLEEILRKEFKFYEQNLQGHNRTFWEQDKEALIESLYRRRREKRSRRKLEAERRGREEQRWKKVIYDVRKVIVYVMLGLSIVLFSGIFIILFVVALKMISSEVELVLNSGKKLTEVAKVVGLGSFYVFSVYFIVRGLI